MSETHRVHFPGSGFASLDLPEGVTLSTELTAVNSPLLFGCRSGICGTCLAEVEVLSGSCEPPAEEEAEALEIFAPENPKARLICQMRLTAEMSLCKIEPA